MVMNAEHRNIRSPSPAMVTSPNEWQILEQTLPISCEILPSVELIHYEEHDTCYRWWWSFASFSIVKTRHFWTVFINMQKKNYQNDVVSFQPMQAPELRSASVKIQGIECHWSFFWFKNYIQMNNRTYSRRFLNKCTKYTTFRKSPWTEFRGIWL